MKNDVRNKMYQQERYAIVNDNNDNWASEVKKSVIFSSVT